jgi:hypothetical protein
VTRGKDTWVGSEAWIAERLTMAAQYAGTAGTFGERAQELRAEAVAVADSSERHAQIIAMVDYMAAQRRHYLALAAAAVDDALPFLAPHAKRA